MFSRSRARTCGALIAWGLFGFVVGCAGANCHQSIALVSGIALDTVLAQAAAPTPNPSCPCSGCGIAGGCLALDIIALDESGGGESDPLFGSTPYTFQSGLPGGGATVTSPCGGNFSVVLDPPSNPDPQGQATINGAEDSTSYQKCMRSFEGDCVEWATITTYNNGVVSLTLNGQTVSATYGESSTPSTIANALAVAISNNSTLSSMFVATASGGVVGISAKQPGVEYPWSTSCSYDQTRFSHCSFSASLSPQATLTPTY